MEYCIPAGPDWEQRHFCSVVLQKMGMVAWKVVRCGCRLLFTRTSAPHASENARAKAPQPTTVCGLRTGALYTAPICVLSHLQTCALVLHCCLPGSFVE